MKKYIEKENRTKEKAQKETKFRVSKDRQQPKLSFYLYNLLIMEPDRARKYNKIKYNDMYIAFILVMKCLNKYEISFKNIRCLLWSKRSFVKQQP